MATKTTRKTVASKTVNKKEEVKNVDEVSKNEAQNITVNVDTTKIAEAVASAVAPVKKKTEEYGEEDLILCQSITRGELIYIGAKSGNRYSFANHGDTCEIEVRDLNALRASKSQYLYEPLFIIMDDDFLAQPRYKDVNELYNVLRKHDIEEIINMPLGDFKSALTSLPDGFKKALEDEVATRIHNNEFDSLNKIKAIDEICGTDLRCMIE